MSHRPDLPAGVAPLNSDDPAGVGHYRILGRLGSGGMGAVYLAAAPEGELVAVKLVHPQLARDEHFRARFRTEARLASRVASFSTAPVLDHGEEGGRLYLVTEFIEGVPLDRMVRSRGGLPGSAVQGLAVGIAAALTSIHNAGLVHRDLKPGNVILSLSGTRVIDFGIARALDTPSALTRSGVTMGSPGWMAPEQIVGRPLTSAADIFAWGCLVAYAATGRHPYGGGDPVSVAYRTLHEEPDLDGVPDELYPAVTAALHSDPRRRPSACDLLTRLSGSTADQPAGGHRPAGDHTRLAAVMTPLHHFPVRHRATRPRFWWVVAGGTLLVALSAVLLLGVAYSGDGGQSPGGPGGPGVGTPERSAMPRDRDRGGRDGTAGRRHTTQPAPDPTSTPHDRPGGGGPGIPAPSPSESPGTPPTTPTKPPSPTASDPHTAS